MNAHLHTMSHLFAQLGLPAEPSAIDNFIADHRPLGDGIVLCHASFWTTSQRNFLREEFVGDADWVGVIDELNVRLS